MTVARYPQCVNDAAVYCDTAAGPFQAERPTIVLLHGALNDHSVWSRQTGVLARYCNVLSPDLPGHGRSAGPALQSIEAMADWLLALLDVAGVTRAVLAGHSMGSLIALEAALRQPGRVARLALLGATWPMAVAPALLDTAFKDQASAIRMVARWSYATPAALSGHRLVEQAVELMERLGANDNELLHTDLTACNAYANGELAARSIACPVTLISGNADRMTPLKSSTRLRAVLPHASEVQLDCGHQMMAERPGEVLAALLAAATAG